MRKPLLYIVAAVLILAITATAGLTIYQNHPQNATPQLQALVDAKWANYTSSYPGLKGGLAMKILTASSDYFVSTMLGDNVTDGIHFRTASVTKTFTAASIMQLYQEGKLDIEQKITDNIPGASIPYIPDTADYAIPYKNKITIRQLLEHRAGVFDVDNTAIPQNCTQAYAGQMYVPWVEKTDPYHQFTFDELVGVVAANNLSYFKPGESYHYSDTGYSMLGKIVERVSGQTYDDYVYEHLVVPNGLTQTTLVSGATETKLPEPFEVGYSYIGGVCYETTEDNMSPHVAEGNVITTPADLARWGNRLYSGQAGINSTLVAMMMDVQPFDDQGHYYGLGTQYTEGLGYGHNGGNMGYITVMRYDPKTQVTVVISVSSANFDAMVDELNFMFDLGREAKHLAGYS